MTNFGAKQVDVPAKQMNFNIETHVAKPPLRMESIDRVSKLPVVEEIMNLATNLYGKFRVSVYHMNIGKASVAKVKLLYRISISLAFTSLFVNIYRLGFHICFSRKVQEISRVAAQTRPLPSYHIFSVLFRHISSKRPNSRH
jgi:hypothetical protein